MIEVEAIHKKFGNVMALNNVSFTASQGEILVVLGPSGSGKTTLLEIIAGLVRPDRGVVKIGGRVVEHRTTGLPDIHVPAYKRKVGYVPQDYALFPHLNVYENIAFGLRASHFGGHEIRRRIDELLELIGLKGFEDRLPHQLSGGQRQRVALARALAVEPHVLLLDEPLSNLDANLRARIRIELRSLLSKLGISTIYVTHNLAEAYILSDQVVILTEGRIAGVGKLDDILDNPQSVEAAEFLGLNIKPALISQIENSYVIASTAEHELKCSIRDPNKGLKKGQHAYIAFRPDTVKLFTNAPSNQMSNILWGKVVDVISSRELVRIIIDVGFSLQAVLSRREYERELNLTLNDEVCVQLPPECLKLIPRETGNPLK